MKPGKREAIVSAAVELFARRGLHAVTLRDIGAKSGFLVGSIYHFFPEKKALYNAAVREAANRFALQAERALDTAGKPEARLRAFCHSMIETMASHDPNFTLMDRARTEDTSADFPGVMQDAAVRIYASLGSLLNELTGPSMQPKSTRWIASCIISLLYGAGKLHRNHVGLQRLKSLRERKAFRDSVVDFALGALSARRARVARPSRHSRVR